jgi:ABC-2 type transport system ATP-binding protein
MESNNNENDAIVVRNITKKFSNNQVLNGINLRVAKGTLYVLMGPNGSGKTTLNSIIASVRSPNSGDVEIFGKPPNESKSFMAYIPQENFSMPLLTGRENLLYFAGLLGHSNGESKVLVDGILNKLSLSKDANKRVSAYSGGMRKRLELGTALFPGTEVLILDEPTTGLDPAARRNFLGLLKGLTEGGMTVLLTTHIGADAESASMVGLIDGGRIVAEGTPEYLKENSGLEAVINIETAIENEGIANAKTAANEGIKPLATDVGYRITSEHPEETIPAVIQKLDSIGCRVNRIEASTPSLEDVFFKLTEKALVGGEAQ